MIRHQWTYPIRIPADHVQEFNRNRDALVALAPSNAGDPRILRLEIQDFQTNPIGQLEAWITVIGDAVPSWEIEAARVHDEARLDRLRERRCQLTIDEWRCKRHLLTTDEAETYCSAHRAQAVRDRLRAEHRELKARRARQEVAPSPPKPAPKSYQRKPEPIIRDDDTPILMDRVVAIESLPPDERLIKLSDQVDRRANQLVSWNYSVLGRKHSRRYEGYRSRSDAFAR